MPEAYAVHEAQGDQEAAAQLTFARTLRSLRERSKLSVAAAAKLAELSRTYLWQLENAKARASDQALERLERVYEVERGMLTGKTRTELVDLTTEGFTALAEGLTAKQLQHVAAIMRYLVEANRAQRAVASVIESRGSR